MIKSVIEYLNYTAKRYPQKKAFVDENHAISFSELQQKSLNVGSGILERGITKSPIVVYLKKSVECIIAFMGIAYSGNYYIPIDVDMPRARIEKILKILAPSMIITDLERYETSKEIFYNIEILCMEDILEAKAGTKIQQYSKNVIDTDVLYVFFTSGSTGEPKGVIVSHRSVIDYTEWVTEQFKIDNSDVFGNQAPFYFDNSILDIYQTIKNGATTYILPQIAFSFPKVMLDFLEEKKINTIFWVPSALCFLANKGALSRHHVTSLKKVLFCGEVMPNKQLNQWRAEYPDVLFANLYGPTEITDACTCYIVDRIFNDDEPLPIGKACENSDVFLLDEKDNLIEKHERGKKGEICVRGTCLSYGYYNNKKKTEEVFVQNPLETAYSERIYRTGDIAYFNEYEELVYVTRKDFQIKHLGNRIELGEIEMAVIGLDGIESCCCVYDEINKRIVLFYVGEEQERHIKEMLANTLPAYMIPDRLIKENKLPLNLNGKIDRKLLTEQVIYAG